MSKYRLMVLKLEINTTISRIEWTRSNIGTSLKKGKEMP